jgi:GT2 family glycosyltransferase
MIELSAVMGTYNRLHMLRVCLPKILASGSGIEMEVIINDGGSTDGTVEYLKKMADKDSRIVLILHEKPEGITRAYNECFEKARGTYTTWLSDDTIPVGDSLVKMCELMRTLSPKDMGAFQFRNSSSAPYNIAKIRGFLCPEVSCVFTKTLQKMKGWNTDYPYYGQDNEFDARLLRMGGKIVACKEAFIDHLNHQDELKKENLVKYRAQGHGQKFQIIYFHRYGIRSNYEYPVLGIAPLPGVSKDKIVSTIEHIKGHYKNMNYHLFKSEYSEEVEDQLDYVKEVPWVSKPQWQPFDLVVVIKPNGKNLYSGNGVEITREFAKELLR